MLTWRQGALRQQGIPQEATKELERAFEESGLRVHGYLITSQDSILAERYFHGYDKDSLHRMYSVAKTFVALAVGVMVGEGLAALEDKICDYFPEKLPAEGPHPWCGEMTIKDMLTMRTCHGATTYKNYPGKDWTESFFRVTPDHVPGTVFAYDTSSAHVLGALVEKRTGRKLMDYLREKLPELGLSPKAYLMEDPMGGSQGGSGLMCTLRDVAAVALLFCQGGFLEGRQLLPADFAAQALRMQTPTDLQPRLDEQFGYGYFIWMPRREGFTFFGMGGQLAVCFPKQKLCYITMADTLGVPAGVQLLHDCFYRILWPYAADTGQGDHSQAGAGQTRTGQTDGGHPRRGDGLETQVFPTGRYIFYPNRLGWEWVVFDREKKTMDFGVCGKAFAFSLGEEAGLQPFLDTGESCRCLAYWRAGHLIVKCFVHGEELGNLQLDFAWKDRRLGMRAVCTPDPFPDGTHTRFQGFASAWEEERGVLSEKTEQNKSNTNKESNA